MLNMPLRAVGDAFHEAWRLRWPFLLSHLVFSLVVAAVLAPALALTLRLAIALSGKPALSDFDIAMFLVSPVGFVAALVVASLLLSTYVLDISFMMAIALDARRNRQRRFEAGVAAIVPKFFRIVGFAWRLLLRIVAIVAPFVLLSLVVVQHRLTEYDINYYLAEHPPEFVQAAVLIGVMMLAMLALLVRSLMGWAVALPLVLFEDVAPRDSFGESARRMAGQRLDLFVTLLVWAGVSLIAVAVPFAIVSGGAGLAADAIGLNLTRLAAVLFVFAGIWALLNLLVTTLTTGALADLLMERAGWPGTAGITPNVEKERGTLRLALFVGLVVAAVFGIGGGVDLAARRGADGEVDIIAHRGAAGLRPENTMASFALAIEDEATWVELDVQESADGEVIVVHDSDFMKLAGNPLKVWDATSDELAEIDIGSWFGSEYSGERTPTLRQALELAKDSGSGVLIELKYYGHDEMLEQRVADIVAETGMEDQVEAMSLKYEAVQKMKALRPDWTVGLLAAQSVGRLWELEADFLAVNMAMATPYLVRNAREAGKPLYVWTVNDPLAMSHMLSLGVNGLITDEPALAREVLAQRASLGGAERLVLALGNRLGLSVDDKVYRDGSP
ncbi:glycerophosphodiester phosphodiesterase [Tropicimonas marinistellae]|uniref:glycerophosphodiester phosphodiesterase n=1 Tax=Tropicimonas marinistellae TaxID=1739787 RepID=UPI0008346031|nr:glycerophosphodiester phosphodiesterase [Tropicimonas marinistellae]